MAAKQVLPEKANVVLITGLAGFIGKHVAMQAAQQGCMVHGIGHGSLADEELNLLSVVDFTESDITQEALFALDLKPDIIIHCASSASVALSVADPSLDFSRTVISTQNLLEYIRVCTPKTKLVLPSSAAVYGSSASSPLSTTCALSPVSPYGFHKKIAEEICIQYGKCFGVNSSIVRLFSVYGPGLRRQLFWDACNKLSASVNTFGGTGFESRDWLHVEDAASLLLAAAAHASDSPPIVNGGTSISTYISTAINLIFTRIPNAPRPIFTGKVRIGDPSTLVADISSALKFNWSPQHSLEDGLREYVDWFLSLDS